MGEKRVCRDQGGGGQLPRDHQEKTQESVCMVASPLCVVCFTHAVFLYARALVYHHARPSTSAS